MQANLTKTAGETGDALDIFRAILYNGGERTGGPPPGG